MHASRADAHAAVGYVCRTFQQGVDLGKVLSVITLKVCLRASQAALERACFLREPGVVPG